MQPCAGPSLVPRPNFRLCYATQVTIPMAFCWLGTTKKPLNGHQTPFLVRGCTWYKMVQEMSNLVVQTLIPSEYPCSKKLHILNTSECQGRQYNCLIFFVAVLGEISAVGAAPEQFVSTYYLIIFQRVESTYKLCSIMLPGAEYTKSHNHY